MNGDALQRYTGAMKLLVFQHLACEHPAVLRSFLKEDGISWDAVELDEGGVIPPLEAYDMLWVMGGPHGCVGCRGTSLAHP